MFAEPLVVTINSVAKNLIRVNQDQYSSEYLLRGTLDEFRAKIRHSTYTHSVTKKMMHRHNVELTQTVYPVSPAVVPTIRKAYIVLENEYNDSPTESLNFDNGFVGLISSGNVTKLLNWES